MNNGTRLSRSGGVGLGGGVAMWWLLVIWLGCAPRVEATPVGLVGEPYDMRHLLPQEVERPAALTLESLSSGHVVDITPRVEVRVVTWAASDEQTPFAPTYLAGVGLELQENPDGASVTWRVGDADPKTAVSMEIAVRIPGWSPDELKVTGQVAAASGLFVVDDAQ